MKHILELLSNGVEDTFFECGGILGSSQNEIIDNVVFDDINHQYKFKCSYSPNVEFLNSCVLRWHQKGIRFAGLFHTHFAGVKTLSCADKNYIKIIMKAMPEEIEYLYFPIYVLPARELVGYIAKRSFDDIEIKPEDVFVI